MQIVSCFFNISSAYVTVYENQTENCNIRDKRQVVLLTDKRINIFKFFLHVNKKMKSVSAHCQYKCPFLSGGEKNYAIIFKIKYDEV